MGRSQRPAAVEACGLLMWVQQPQGISALKQVLQRGYLRVGCPGAGFPQMQHLVGGRGCMGLSAEVVGVVFADLVGDFCAVGGPAELFGALVEHVVSAKPVEGHFVVVGEGLGVDDLGFDSSGHESDGFLDGVGGVVGVAEVEHGGFFFLVGVGCFWRPWFNWAGWFHRAGWVQPYRCSHRAGGLQPDHCLVLFFFVWVWFQASIGWVSPLLSFTPVLGWNFPGRVRLGLASL